MPLIQGVRRADADSEPMGPFLSVPCFCYGTLVAMGLRRRVGLCLVAGLSVALPAPADAQPQPQPTPVEAQQQPGSVDTQPREPAPPGWRLDLSAGVGYDDNLRFAPSRESSNSGRLRAGLTRVITASRANVTFGAAGDGTVYRPVRDFDQITYSAGLSANYLVSPRSTLRIAESFSKGYTSDSRALLDAGLFLPRTVTRSNDAVIEASHRITERLTWTASVRHRVAHFDSNVLVDESSFTGRAELAWTRIPESPAGLFYEFGQASRDGRAGSKVHGVNLWAQRRFGEKVSLRLDAGAHKLVSQGSDGNGVVGSRGVQLDFRTPKQAISATATRSVGEALGLGRLQIRSAASLRIARTLATKLALSVNATVSRSQDPGGNAAQAFDTSSLGGDLGFSLTQNARLVATGGYRRLAPGAAGGTHSRFATLALTVGQIW